MPPEDKREPGPFEHILKKAEDDASIRLTPNFDDSSEDVAPAGPFDHVFKQDASIKRMQLAEAVSRELNPEREARIHKISSDLGVPPEMIRPNLEQFEKETAGGRINVDLVLKRSPRLARFLTTRPGVAVDDVSTLSGLEWAVSSAIGAFKFGAKQSEYGARAFAQMNKLPGFAGPENEEKLRNLEQHTLRRYFGDESFIESGWVEFWKMVPQIIGGAISGATLAGVAGQLGPQAATPEEVATVPGSAIAGAFAWSFIQETGFTYRSIQEKARAEGRDIDPMTTYMLSSGAGALIAAIETVQLGRVLKIVPGGTQMLAKAGMGEFSKALERRTFKEALVKFGKDFGSAAAWEPATEMSQELVQIFAGVAAKKISGGDWDPEDWEQNGREIVEVGLKTFEAMVVGGAFMSGPKLFIDSVDAGRTAREVARLEAMTGSARASKLLKRSPKLFRELVTMMKEKHGAVKDVFISIEKWNEAVSKLGHDPEAIANDLIGDGQYAKLMSNGGQGELIVPIEQYLSKIAPTDLHKAVAGHARLQLESKSFVEIEQAREETANDLDEVVAEVVAMMGEQAKEANLEEALSDAEMKIFKHEQQKLLETTDDLVEAEAVALVNAKMFTRRAERAGIDPVEHYETYELGYHNYADRVEQEGARVHRETEQGVAIRRAVNPATRELDDDAKQTRKVINGLKAGDQVAINEAVEEMSALVTEGTTMLVPVQGEQGGTETNRLVAEALSRKTGIPMRDALISDPTEAPDEGATDDRRRAEGEPADPGQAGSEADRAEGRGAPTYGTPVEGAVSVQAVHYSRQARESLSGDKYGTGMKGAEGRRLRNSTDERLQQRIYFYVDKGKGITPERGVGDVAHEVQLDNIYDPATKLIPSQADSNAFESAVLDAGFDGYLAPFGDQDAVVLLGPQHTAVPVRVPGASIKEQRSGEDRRQNLRLRSAFARAAKEQDLKAEEEADILRKAISGEISTESDIEAALHDAARRVEELMAVEPEIADDEGVLLIDAVRTTGRRIADAQKLLPKSKYLAYAQEDVELQQTVSLRRGRENIRKWGLDPDKRPTVRRVAMALERRQRELYGEIARDDRSDESAAKIARWIGAEVRFSLDHPSDSGAGWYSEKMQAGLDTLGGTYPELVREDAFGEDAPVGVQYLENATNARNFITALIAITSQGNKVIANWNAALGAYIEFRDTGDISADRVFPGAMGSGVKISEGVREFLGLMRQWGPEGVHDYLMETTTVGEYNKSRRAEGLSVSSDFPAETTIPIAAVFLGPKVGTFYANLMGSEGYLTMDRWWNRTFNRYRGTLIPIVTDERYDNLRMLLGSPDMTKDELLIESVRLHNEAAAVGYVGSKMTKVQKAGNRIWQDVMENVQDEPFNPSDRAFMTKAMQRAHANLKRSGIDISIADMQAILWYYEKRLYGELGAKASQDIAYDEAARVVVAKHRSDRHGERSLPRHGTVVQTGPDGVEFETVPGEDADYLDQEAEEQGLVTLNQAIFRSEPIEIGEIESKGDDASRQYTVRDTSGAVRALAFVSSDDAGSVLVDDIMSVDNSLSPEEPQALRDSSGTLGVTGVRRLISAIRKDFPDAKRIGGKRISGTRTRQAMRSDGGVTTSVELGHPVSDGTSVVFEVAPDPGDAKLSERWNALSQDARLAISKRVAAAVMPGVLESVGASGEIVTQVGSYLEDTNPSFAIKINRGDASALARATGFALSQASMMVTSPTEFPGSFKSTAIRVVVGDKSAEEIANIYATLRGITIDGSQPISGQSTSDGRMDILLDEGVDADAVAEAVDAALERAHDVDVHEVFASFPESEEYDYADEKSDPAGNEGVARQRARAAKAEASRLIGEELDAAEVEGEPQVLSPSIAIDETMAMLSRLAPTEFLRSLTYTVRPTNGYFSIEAHLDDTGSVGYVDFTLVDNKLVPDVAFTDERYQRKGVASYLYRAASETTGFLVAAGDIQTEEGSAFRTHRKFRGHELPGVAQSARAAGLHRFSEVRLFQKVEGGLQFTKKLQREENVAYKIRHPTDKRRNVGNVAGFEVAGVNRSLPGDSAFHIVRTIIDESQRGTGLYQNAIQEIADQYPDGAYVGKFEASQALRKALRKMPTFEAVDDGEVLVIRPSATSLSQKGSVVDTPEFKAWFGDSKVVDEDGKPLVVYHGTDAKFDVFENRGGQVRVLFSTFDVKRQGFFFSPDVPTAESFGSNVVSAFLSIQNPADMLDGASWDRLVDQLVDKGLNKKWLNSLESWELFDEEDGELLVSTLKELGYDGAIMEEPPVPGEREAGVAYVAFDPAQIKSATSNVGTFDPDNPSILQQAKKGDIPRGNITFNRGGRKFDIGLFKDKNPSTLFHEIAHFHLEALGDLATSGKATAQIRRDYAATLKFLGVEKRQQIGDDQQERFALAFEQYLREGVAPSEDLRPLFARIKAWMATVYREIRELVKLSPEIRGVFDRMLASDQQIRQAQAVLNLQPLESAFPDMTAEDRAEQIEANRLAQEESESDLLAQLMADHSDVKAWFEDRTTEIRAQVEAEFEKSPRMRAVYFLQKGKELGSDTVQASLMTDRPEGMANQTLKLDAEIILERYGADMLRQLPRDEYVYVRNSKKKPNDRAADPDAIAIQLGFKNGTALMEALADAPRYNDALEEAVQRRVHARFGDLLKEPSNLAAAAMTAAQGEKRIDQLILEVRWLKRQIEPSKRQNRSRPFERQAMKDAARRTISNEKVGGLRPHVYQRNAQKHGRLAFEAAEKGNTAKAYDEKVLQLMNMMLYREARDVKLEIDQAVRLFRRMQKGPAQTRLGKAGESYLAQVNALLENFELRTESKKAVSKRQSLREWIQERIADGEEALELDPHLAEKSKTHYTELSVADLRNIRDTIKNIDALAGLKTTLLDNEDRRQYNDAINELVASAEANVKTTGKWEPDAGKRRRGWISNAAGEWDARLLRMVEVFERLDGRDADGPWSRYIWNLMSDAQAREQDLQLGVTMKLAEAFEKMNPERRKLLLTEDVTVPSLGVTVSREAAISVALNWGSDSNRQRLIEGGIGIVKKEDMALWPKAMNEILDSLSREDWMFVQEVWDTISGTELNEKGEPLRDSLWNMISDMEQELTGVRPAKVPPSAFTREFKDGTTLWMRGGYYPLVYSPRSRQGRQQLEAGTSTAVLFDHRYVRAMTPHGHIHKRVDTFKAELETSLDAIPKHMNQVIHDLTHRKAILQVNKILNDKRIVDLIYDRMGKPRHDAMLQWLKRIANDRITEDHFIDSFLRGARMNLTVVAMGGKATTSLQNFANILNVFEASRGVKHKYFWPAFREFHTPGSRKQIMEEVHRRSGEMRHRFNNLDREIREAMRDSMSTLGKMSGAKKQLHMAQRFAFGAIAATDKITAYPTWLAAYREQIDDGKTERQAVTKADRVVTTMLGANAAKDIAQIQAGGEAMKLFTMFYSWFSLTYMRFRALGFDIKSERWKEEGRAHMGLPWFLSRMFMFWIGPAIVSEMLSGRGPKRDDDEEGYLEWMLTKTLFYPTMTVPWLRDFFSLVQGRVEGQNRDVTYGPLGRVMSEMVRAAEKIYEEGGDALVDPADFDAKTGSKAAANFLGYAMGLPANQFNISSQYIWNWLDGSEHPEDVVDFAMGVLYRPTKESKSKDSRRKSR